MAGRAGRPQYDPYGEAIIADAPNPIIAQQYIRGKPENVESKLWNERALRIHTLATIVSGYARNHRELIEFFSKTFGARSARIIITQNLITKTIKKLIEMNMIKNHEKEYEPTLLGISVSRLYIDPLTANIILRGLSIKSSVSDIYYLMLIALTPDFDRVRIFRFSQLYDEAIALAESREIPPPPDELGIEDISLNSWLRAYKIARILYDWINEVDEDTIIENYGIGLGDLVNMIDTAVWLAYAAAKICKTVNLIQHSQKLEKIYLRIEKGVKEDALDLVKIRGIGRVRARILINAGIKTVEDLLHTPKSKLISLPYFGEHIVEEILNNAKQVISKEG